MFFFFTSQSSPPLRLVIDLRQCNSHASCCTSNLPPKRLGNESLGIWRVNCGIDTVKTLSLNFSRTKSRRILKGALNHSGAVTIKTFFNFAGYPPWKKKPKLKKNLKFSQNTKKSNFQKFPRRFPKISPKLPYIKKKLQKTQKKKITKFSDAREKKFPKIFLPISPNFSSSVTPKISQNFKYSLKNQKIREEYFSKFSKKDRAPSRDFRSFPKAPWKLYCIGVKIVKFSRTFADGRLGLTPKLRCNFPSLLSPFSENREPKNNLSRLHERFNSVKSSTSDLRRQVFCWVNPRESNKKLPFDVPVRRLTVVGRKYRSNVTTRDLCTPISLYDRKPSESAKRKKKETRKFPTNETIHDNRGIFDSYFRFAYLVPAHYSFM